MLRTNQTERDSKPRPRRAVFLELSRGVPHDGSGHALKCVIKKVKKLPAALLLNHEKVNLLLWAAMQKEEKNTKVGDGLLTDRKLFPKRVTTC